MSGSILDDRDARRKARHRGNPERARFQRQPDSELFTIRTSCEPPAAKSSSSLELVQHMRGVSLADKISGNLGIQPTPPAKAQVELPRPAAPFAALVSSVPLPPDVAGSGLEFEESDICEPVQPRDDKDGNSPPCLAELPEDDDNDDEDNDEKKLRASLQPPPLPPPGLETTIRRRRQRPRETVNTHNIEDVLKDVPARLTRSMARKIGG
ncbi:hypothetical protein EV174_006541, partial [Coemansia sp. RSA 2320]